MKRNSSMRKINFLGQSHKISDLLLGGKEKLSLDPDDQTKIVSRNGSCYKDVSIKTFPM